MITRLWLAGFVGVGLLCVDSDALSADYTQTLSGISEPTHGISCAD